MTTDVLTTAPAESGWKGYLFQNPDTEANLLLGQIAGTNKPWGAHLTADEIRYFYFTGQESLVTQSGSYITDSMIRGLIDHYTRTVADELKHDIYPRAWRAPSPDITETRDIEPWAEEDPAYALDNSRYRSRYVVILRHAPVINVTRFDLYEPYGDTRLLDLLPYADVNRKAGILQNVRAIGPVTGVSGTLPIRGTRTHLGAVTRDRVPNAYYVDYTTGYTSAQRVPRELVDVIAKLVSIAIMSAHGDGKVAGTASMSLSLGSISESVSTTQSATSATFGARILQMTNELKDWWQTSASRYRRPSVSIL